MQYSVQIDKDSEMIHWKHPKPFILPHTVTAEEIDLFHHVNNKTYLNWVEHIAWQHSLSVGIDEALQKKLGKIMVVKQHQLNYHRGCFLGDELWLGTWIGELLNSRSRKRYYQFFNKKDEKLVFSGHTVWSCMDLTTYQGCTIPQGYIKPYQIA